MEQKLVFISAHELITLIRDAVRDDEKANKSGQKSKEENPILTIGQVALYYDISIATVHNWSKSGKLKKHLINGRTYFKRSELPLI